MKIISKKRNMRFGNVRVNRGEVTEVSEMFRASIEKNFSNEIDFVTDEVIEEQEVTAEEVTDEVKEEPKKKATRPKKK